MAKSLTASGKAVTSKGMLHTECAVALGIQAPIEKVWDLLTNAGEYTNWNTTVISLSGQIALGETIHLKSTASPERTFNLKVTTFDRPHKMVWEDGFAPMFKGVRTYTLATQSGGITEFTMREIIRGLMLPMIRSSLPDFGPTFEKFADDLKRTAES